MQNELTPQEQAKLFYSELLKDCEKEFKEAGIELHNPVFRISDYNIEIAVADKSGKYQSLFASDIQLYSRYQMFSSDAKNEINFGSSGSFTPEYEAPYWRTMNAANILSNWDKACEIVNKYCAKHKEFYSKF